jgi:hypothetical protein
MNNWKTTIGGALSALGTTLAGVGTVGCIASLADNGKVKTFIVVCTLAGFILSAVGKFFGMLFAADALPANQDKSTDASGSGSKAGLIVLTIGLAALVFGAVACAHVQPGNDPLVVHVEQVQTTAKGAFDLVLNVDNANRNFYRTNAPGFHSFCEWLRVPTATSDGGTLPRASAMLWTLDAEKLAYKNGTATSNAVTTALVIVTESVNQAQTWIATLNLK